MASYTLILLEITSIQEYVFGSNHLAQNIGASELVYRVTTQWLQDTCEQLGISSNIQRWDEAEGLQLDQAKLITDKNIAAEVVYAGGGNAMLLLTNDQASAFIRHLTGRVLVEAAGLQLVIVQRQFDLDAQVLANIHREMREELARRKLNHTSSVPLLGLGVTAQCVFTGLPAVGYSNDPHVVGQEAATKVEKVGEERQLISAEVAHKLHYEHIGRGRLKAILPTEIMDRFSLVYNFDEFGTKDEANYIAIIHADGNNMGNRFDEIARPCATVEQNREYINRLRDFSDSIQKASQKALKATVDYLYASLWPDEQGQPKFGRRAPIPRSRSGEELLPFRPIVFGGDDVTFVADGRLGLALAVKYLQEFTRENLSDHKPVYARAGVAIVRAHFPFSRAYLLAEQLTKTAKKALLNQPEMIPKGQAGANAIDWHFSTTGINVSLDELRRREYSPRSAQPDHSLLMRPVRVDSVETNGNQPDEFWRTWQVFAGLVDHFQNSQAWAGRRNKLVSLRRALREERESVKLFMANYRIKNLPPIPGQPDMQLQGWQGKECGYYDALEAVDFFVSLEPPTVGGH